MKIIDLINRSGTLKPKTCIDTSTEKIFRCNAAQICCGSGCCADEYLNAVLWVSGGLILAVTLCIIILWYIFHWCRKETEVICVKQKLVHAAVRQFKDCMLKKKEDGDGSHVCTKTSLSPADLSLAYSVSPSKYRQENMTWSVDKKPLQDDCVWDKPIPRLLPQSSQI